MTDRGDTPTRTNDPRWFDLLMASRWPLAVVLAAWSGTFSCLNQN